MFGLLGKKLGMTQMFDEQGNAVPVTALSVGPCRVVQKKTSSHDGYNALQLGFETCKEKQVTKPKAGHLKKHGSPLYRFLGEFRMAEETAIQEGQMLTVAAFRVGDIVNVQGLTKGRGFQGAMKRHGKHGGPATHGSDFHRRPGSIGMRAQPGRVPKNMKMPGHYGNETVTIRNLRVVAVRPEDHVLLVRGAIPGSRGGVVEIVTVDPQVFTRDELKPVVPSKAPTA